MGIKGVELCKTEEIGKIQIIEKKSDYSIRLELHDKIVELYRVTLYNPATQMHMRPVSVIADRPSSAISQASCMIQDECKNIDKYEVEMKQKSIVNIEPLLLRGWNARNFSE